MSSDRKGCCGACCWRPDRNEPNPLARGRLAACDRKLARHRAALEAGADPTVVTGWIAEVEAERRRVLTTLERPDEGSGRMTRDQIAALVQQVGEIIDALREAISPTGPRSTSNSGSG